MPPKSFPISVLSPNSSTFATASRVTAVSLPIFSSKISCSPHSSHVIQTFSPPPSCAVTHTHALSPHSVLIRRSKPSIYRRLDS
ncbi:hypothetical protein E2C01_099756 [Portunus trituberculatus]|uniref:Uncharacterized protein n=1 Tax=Portunus trituberculatus TaxID=210409 RepID=A0A5B7KBR2_PORTR|nr:hypothetical protein [Portunus trituberculatus]